jgi:succinate dehydrogenase / fumarate reductase cytochrome b subunit
MAGNLLLFAGRDALNSYAHALKARPSFLWTARVALLAILVVHLYLAFRLWLENRTARPTRYVYEDTIQASWASRHMLLTGLVLLAFIAYHLAHFTLGVVTKASVQSTASGLVDLSPPRNYLELSDIRPSSGEDHVPEPGVPLSQAMKDDKDARQDVYSMVISGFRNPWVSLSYLIAMAFLGLHLWHGGSSFLQSLGFNNRRWAGLVGSLGPLIAIAVVAGNCAIVLSVWLGVIR